MELCGWNSLNQLLDLSDQCYKAILSSREKYFNFRSTVTLIWILYNPDLFFLFSRLSISAFVCHIVFQTYEIFVLQKILKINVTNRH